MKILIGLTALVVLSSVAVVGCSGGSEPVDAGDSSAVAAESDAAPESDAQEMGATLSLTVSQPEYAAMSTVLENGGRSYCAWYGGTAEERTEVGIFEPETEILRVNILGDSGEVISSTVMDPVPVSEEMRSILEESGLGIFSVTIPTCSFTATLADLPRDQKTYTIEVLADKVEGFETDAKKFVTGPEAEAADWNIEVTIP